eukprot:g37200.t1
MQFAAESSSLEMLWSTGLRKLLDDIEFHTGKQSIGLQNMKEAHPGETSSLLIGLRIFVLTHYPTYKHSSVPFSVKFFPRAVLHFIFHDLECPQISSSNKFIREILGHLMGVPMSERTI